MNKEPQIEEIAKKLHIEEEQKTCKNITKCHPVDEFICSECGLILEEYYEKRIDDGDETYHEYEIKYCPNCGAKVVEE